MTVKRNQWRTHAVRNDRGSDDDRRQIIADLIASDDTPFVPDDDQALRMMTDDALKAMRDGFMKPKKAKDAPKGNAFRLNCSQDELQAIVNKAVAQAVASLTDGDNTGSITKPAAEKARLEKIATKALVEAGIPNPTPEQVAAMVRTMMGGMDDDGDDDPSVKAMSAYRCLATYMRDKASGTIPAPHLERRGLRPSDAVRNRARQALTANDGANANDPEVKAMRAGSVLGSALLADKAKRQNDRAAADKRAASEKHAAPKNSFGRIVDGDR